MQDKTINSALLALRRQIIRGKCDGLAQVEALLQMRGVPMPAVLPRKRKDAARQGMMRFYVTSALGDGPKTLREIAAYVAEKRPELPYRAAYIRTTQCLSRMKNDKMAVREGRFWRLAP